MMTQRIMEICGEVQEFLNNSYNYFAKKFCNIDEHVFDIKQEVIAKSGLFITKKRYGLRIINDAGRKVNKIHVKGLDTIRSNFAVAMKDLLQNVLDDILADVPKEKIDERISVFKRNMTSLHYDVLANPIGVKGIGKYQVKDIESAFSSYKKGTPVHVKSAINYNDMLHHFGIRDHETIKDGDKIKWAYLKGNPYGFDTIALRGYDDPPEVVEFVNMYIDRDKMFQSDLQGKIDDFYAAMNWGKLPENNAVNKFFSFGN